MASLNWKQIYDLNSTATFLSTDIFYLARSPYGIGNDYGFLYSSLIPITTKGDLFTFSTINARIGVGANGTLLTPDSATATGLKWTTTTFPASISINQLLYASADNVLTAFGTTNSSVLTTTSAGVPFYPGSMTNGQLLIGSTGGNPTLATLTPGIGMAVTNGAGSVTISTSGGGLSTVKVAGNTQTIAVNTRYIATNALQTVFTLPATFAVGDVFGIVGESGSGGWKINCALGVTIYVGDGFVTGATDSIQSTDPTDAIYLTCDTANTVWITPLPPQGNIFLSTGVSGTNNAVNTSLALQTGTGKFVGDTTPTFTTKITIVGNTNNFQYLSSDVATDATIKNTRLGLPHYTNAQAPLTLVFGTSTAAVSSVDIGGGTGFGNAATLVSIYAAANNTTTLGTEIARYTTSGMSLLNGNLTLSSTNPRVLADMSNATFAARLNFQSTTTNGASTLGVIPNGTGTTSAFSAHSLADPDNSSYIQIYATNASSVGINSAKNGTGAVQNINFQFSGTSTAFITTTGSIVCKTAALLTTATDGFLYIPSCAGAATGVPTAQTGTIPMVYDSTGNNLSVYNGGVWKTVAFPSSGGGVTTLAGNSGTATGSTTLTITTGAANASGTALFTGSGTTLTLTFSDNSTNKNTCLGALSLQSLSTGVQCTSLGYNTLHANTSGARNTAVGCFALQAISSGADCTATGWNALIACTGNQNTAMGSNCLSSLTSGTSNTGYGVNSLLSITTGVDNACFGHGSGSSLTLADSNNICIGISVTGTAGDSNTIRIGNGTQNRVFFTGIRGITTGVNNAIAVLIDGSSQMGTVSSSARYKDNIRTIDDVSSMRIQQLRPVAFNYSQFNADRAEYGLIAEEVAEIIPEIVVYKDELPETIQYHKLDGLMIAEIQRLNRKIVALENMIK